MPYVELRTGLDPETQQYARLVDGDEATTDPQQNIESLVPLTLASDPQLITVGAEADPATVLGGTPCLAGVEPIGTLPGVRPVVFNRSYDDWVGRVPWLGVQSYRCTLVGPPAIVAEDRPGRSSCPAETLEVASGADLPLDFRSAKVPITASNTSAVRATAKLDGSVVGTIDLAMSGCVPTTTGTSMR